MGVLEFLRDLSILGAMMMSIYATCSWLRGSKAKKKIELAEEVLNLFYNAEDAIRMIRLRRNLGSYKPAGEANFDENPEEKEARDIAYFSRGYMNCKDLFNRIHSMRYRFAVQFGKKSAEPFDDLNKLIRALLAASRKLAEIQARTQGETAEDGYKHDYRREKYEAILWADSEDDEVNLKLKSIVRRVEDTCYTSILSRPFLSYRISKFPELVKTWVKSISKPKWMTSSMGRVSGR